MSQQTWDGRHETGEKETGDGRQKTGDGRRDREKSDVISGKFCAFNLASEFYNFVRQLIVNKKI